MRFEEFWKYLEKGGETPKGDKFKVTADNRLHIISPGNKNCKYYITKDTVKRYFEKDIPDMGEKSLD